MAITIEYLPSADDDRKREEKLGHVVLIQQSGRQGMIGKVFEVPIAVKPKHDAYWVEVRGRKKFFKHVARETYRHAGAHSADGDRIVMVIYGSNRKPLSSPSALYSCVRHVLHGGENPVQQSLMFHFMRKAVETLALPSDDDRLTQWRATILPAGSGGDMSELDDQSLRVIEEIDGNTVVLNLEPAERSYRDSAGNPVMANYQDPVWRADFISRYEVWNASEAAARLGRGQNPAEYMRKLVERGKIFRIKHQGPYLYPAFMFDVSGDPLPVIGKLMALFGDQENVGWRLAQFLDEPNGYLGEPDDGPAARRPVELLGTAPQQLEKVARRQFAASDVF